MILTELDALRNAQNTGYNPYLQAKIDKAVFLGYTLPSVSELNDLNVLFESLNAEGFMSACDSLQIYKSEEEQWSAIDCIDPNRVATYVNSIWVLNTGLVGDSATKYANTNYNPTTGLGNFTQNDAAVHFYLKSEDPTGNTTGRYFTNSSQELLAKNQGVGSMRHRLNSISTFNGSSSTTDDILVSFIRSTNTEYKVYIDGVLSNTETVGSVALTNSVIEMFRNFGTNYGEGTISMIAFTDSSVEANILNIYNAFNTFGL